MKWAFLILSGFGLNLLERYTLTALGAPQDTWRVMVAMMAAFAVGAIISATKFD